MPREDGIEMIRRIRSMRVRIKIIAMSGGSGGEDTPALVPAHNAGAHAILLKPFRAAELLRTASQVLEMA
jgi:CheY-like chemotaxis protein